MEEAKEHNSGGQPRNFLMNVLILQCYIFIWGKGIMLILFMRPSILYLKYHDYQYVLSKIQSPGNKLT